MEFKTLVDQGARPQICLLQSLIRHDILIRSQMYHTVIMEYFSKD